MKESQILAEIVLRLLKSAEGKPIEIDVMRYAIEHYDTALFVEKYKQDQAEKGGSANGV